MLSSIDVHSLTQDGYFGEATILDHNQEKYRVRIPVECVSRGYSKTTTHSTSSTAVPHMHQHGIPLWAKSALGSSSRLTWGDTVLVAGDTLDTLYIIGVLKSRSITEDEHAIPGEVDGINGIDGRKLTLSDGTRANIETASGEEKLQFFSKEGQMLYEYDAKSGQSAIHVQNGDLKFIADNGRIQFVGAKGISFSSPETIAVNSKKEIKLMAHRLETAVDTVMEKSINVYRTVENLAQVTAGRMRTLVQGTSHFKSRKAVFKAEKDFKIKGDKIHLG
ncbi:MAG: DUF3540 domain-containing protein [Desulfamplus sp.]|nr:DUF3540 domain-containing protein [Desulfamplus sp.]